MPDHVERRRRFEIRSSEQTRKANLWRATRVTPQHCGVNQPGEVDSYGVMGTRCHNIKQQLKSFKLNDIFSLFAVFSQTKVLTTPLDAWYMLCHNANVIALTVSLCFVEYRPTIVSVIHIWQMRRLRRWIVGYNNYNYNNNSSYYYYYYFYPRYLFPREV